MDAATIVVVDDEQPIVGLVASYLGAEGFSVQRAFDGPSALALARATRPDLVILNVMLPGLDGIEVCRRLHQESAVYVLMLTARTDEVDKLLGRNQPACILAISKILLYLLCTYAHEHRQEPVGA